MLKVTLKKSLIGSLPNQKATAASLGLRKIGDSIVTRTTRYSPENSRSLDIL